MRKDPFITAVFPGGGPRSIVSSLNAHAMEEAIGGPLIHRIDLLGCFSGGIFSGPTLALPKEPGSPEPKYRPLQNAWMTAKGAPDVFPWNISQATRMLKNTFGSGALYDKAPLREGLETVYGDATINDLMIPTVIAAENAKTHDAILMTNIGDDPTGHIPLVVAGCGTTALPKVFEQEAYTLETEPGVMEELKLCDGITSFSLAEDLYEIGEELRDPDQEHIMIVFGTGFSAPDYEGMAGKNAARAAVKTINAAMHVSEKKALKKVRKKLGDNLIVLNASIPKYKEVVLGDPRAEFPSDTPTNGSLKNAESFIDFARWIREDVHPEGFARAQQILEDKSSPSWLNQQRSIQALEAVRQYAENAPTRPDFDRVFDEARGILPEGVIPQYPEIYGSVADMQSAEKGQFITLKTLMLERDDGLPRKEFPQDASPVVHTRMFSGFSRATLRRKAGSAVATAASYFPALRSS